MRTKGKTTKGLGILTKLRHYLPNRILVNLYYTLIHPYYDYCNNGGLLALVPT